jgi:general secretion pathway protein A
MNAITLTDTGNGYLQHFGLRSNPFPVAPDDDNFYFSEHINQIIAEIVHGVTARKGFMVLTGDIGLGKTTISRRIITMLEGEGITTALVFHTALQDAELLREINRDFGLLKDTPDGHAAPVLSVEMARLNDFLLAQNQQQKNCTIVIDDAQNLSPQSLELVRMISNLEADQQKLVQILLVGQPELMQRLDSHELRQLKSRIIIQKEVRPLGRDELKNYIHFKLNMAGSSGAVALTRSAFRCIHRLTRGNFRAVNRLMDRALYVACLKNRQTVDRGMLGLAQTDLDGGTLGSRWPWGMALATVLSLGLLAMGAFFFSDFQIWPLKAAAVKAQLVPSPPKTTASVAGSAAEADTPAVTGEALTAVSNGDADLNPQAGADPPVPSRERAKVPLAVKAFFDNSHLYRYAAVFIRAAKNGEIEPLSQEIYAQTGLRLVQLDNLPESIRRRHGVLTYPMGPEGRLCHFVLWRPRLEFKKFHYYYVGEDVFALQKWLARLGHYTDKLDSIVGAHLMKGIVDFQRAQGLPVTGFPDTATLFLLSGLQEVPANG